MLPAASKSRRRRIVSDESDKKSDSDEGLIPDKKPEKRNQE